jgi:hypothetical protein
VTASETSDTGSETEGSNDAKNGNKFEINYPLLSHHWKHNMIIGKPGLTAWSYKF